MLSPSYNFEFFLAKLKNKTWREVLRLVEVEMYKFDPGLKTSLRNPPRAGSYLSELSNFFCYCRYPEVMPECYKNVFLTMIDPPLLLLRKLAELLEVSRSHQPREQDPAILG